MAKSRHRNDGPPQEPSNYQRKLQGRNEGRLEPFEFRERTSREEQSQPGVTQIVSNPRHVRATIETVKSSQGYMFLRTENGQVLFLAIRIFRRDCKGHKHEVGLLLDCEVNLAFAEKRPPVVRILSVVSTDAPAPVS